MHNRLIAAAAALLAIHLLCTASETASPDRYPLRQDLSGFHRQVTTKSTDAQKYFDQGLTLYYGFNHDAAVASFDEAAKLDPKCAMAYWGHAISVGPNINVPFMDSSQAKAAWDDVQMAARLAKHASPVERELIRALRNRYAWPPPADRKPLDIAYANEMRKVWNQFPNDPDVGALFADAMMNLRPWDLFKANGEPYPGTTEIMSTLEKVMAMVPDHPGANHFYIHTCEASPFPQLALPSAERLATRIPGAAHLVHMPAHIYVRLGRYEDAIKANQNAIEVDKADWADQPGVYMIYRAHNYHFLAYAAMFEGREELATTAVRSMVEAIPDEVTRMFPDYIEAILGAPYHVLVRFGKWDEMLKEPQPPADMQARTAFWHYGRTVALASLGRVPEAEAEFSELKKACDAVPQSRLLGNNPARTVLDIGLALAEGELEYRKGNYDHAFQLLRLATQRDDSLHYDEPWGWMMPASHALGALLLEQGRLPEAEQVYRDDLRLHPANGWALKGLAEVFHRTHRETEAQEAEAQFAQAWSRSDTKIEASCFCRRGFLADVKTASQK